MLFEVYAKEKRTPQAGVPAMPMEETLQNLRQSIASDNQDLTKRDEVFAPIITSLADTTKHFDKYTVMPEFRKELKKRVDIKV